MKKLLTSLTGILAFALASIAQHDVQVTLVSPASGASATGVSNFTISYNIKNNGPDQIAAGDTLFLTVLIGTQNYSLTGEVDAVSVVVLPVAIPSGTTLPSASIGLNATVNLTGVSGPVCVFAGIGEASLDTGDPNDSNMLNNLDCFTSVPASAGIQEHAESVAIAYPNPANSILTVSVEGSELSGIFIIALDGKVVSTTIGSTVDVSSLNAGMYFYEATTITGEVIRNSFMKN